MLKQRKEEIRRDFHSKIKVKKPKLITIQDDEFVVEAITDSTELEKEPDIEELRLAHEDDYYQTQAIRPHASMFYFYINGNKKVI